MNFEEGFRRIGVATHILGLSVGVAGFLISMSVLVGLFLWLCVYLFFHLVMYVLKGFFKSDERAKEPSGQK